jgi:hypothetical protein
MTTQEILSKLESLDNALYYYNAKVISLKHIAFKKPFTEHDISFLNQFLGQRIKDVRDIKEMVEEEK